MPVTRKPLEPAIAGTRRTSGAQSRERSTFGHAVLRNILPPGGFRTYFYHDPHGLRSMPTLEVRRLKIAFDGHEVLRDVSFGMQDGELAAILGPSGGGKTTLFRCILGELRPMAGEILIDGQDVARLPTERRGLGGGVPSLPAVPHPTGAQNIRYRAPAPRVVADRAEGRVAAIGDPLP